MVVGRIGGTTIFMCGTTLLSHAYRRGTALARDFSHALHLQFKRSRRLLRMSHISGQLYGRVERCAPGNNVKARATRVQAHFVRLFTWVVSRFPTTYHNRSV